MVLQISRVSIENFIENGEGSQKNIFSRGFSGTENANCSLAKKLFLTHVLSLGITKVIVTNSASFSI